MREVYLVALLPQRAQGVGDGHKATLGLARRDGAIKGGGDVLAFLLGDSANLGKVLLVL